MFRRKSKKPDWDLLKLSDEELERLPLEELQRIRNKCWANDLKDLQKTADEELARRDPKKNWYCIRCGKTHFHEHEVRVAGSFVEAFIGWERNKYHVIACNYCGKSEFYKTMMPAGEQGLAIMGN